MQDGACGNVLAELLVIGENDAECDRPEEKFVPFLSSIVTVSFAHFMRNLGGGSALLRGDEP